MKSFHGAQHYLKPPAWNTRGVRVSPLDLSLIVDHYSDVNPPYIRSWFRYWPSPDCFHRFHVFLFPLSLLSLSLILHIKTPSYHWAEHHHSSVITSKLPDGKAGHAHSLCLSMCQSHSFCLSHSVCPLHTITSLSVTSPWNSISFPAWYTLKTYYCSAWLSASKSTVWLGLSSITWLDFVLYLWSVSISKNKSFLLDCDWRMLQDSPTTWGNQVLCWESLRCSPLQTGQLSIGAFIPNLDYYIITCVIVCLLNLCPECWDGKSATAHVLARMQSSA